jgi:hypothetical protein
MQKLPNDYVIHLDRDQSSIDQLDSEFEGLIPFFAFSAREAVSRSVLTLLWNACGVLWHVVIKR